jgi:signal transduction histidine kinase
LERTFNQLTSVRVEKSRNLIGFFSDREKEVELIANSNKFYKIFEETTSSNQSKIELIEFLESFLSTNDYYNKIIIINKNNLSLVIDKNNRITNYLFQNSDTSEESRNSIKVAQSVMKENISLYDDYITETDGSISFIISQPIIYKNEYLGVLLFKIKTSGINNIMLTKGKLGGLGKTGESYIVGNDSLLRTSSRFKKNSVKNILVNTEAVKQALYNHSGSRILRDYRNIEVLSSFAPLNIKNLRWAIVAEIDKEEALQPVYNLRNSIVLLCIILSIFIFGLVYWGSSKLTNPVISLNEAANKISQGDYNIRLERKSNDEIGELITSFNKMAKDLYAQSELLKKEKLLRISSVLDAQEKERQRLSRDLHDGLGQMMLAVKIKLEQIQNKGLENSESRLNEAIELLKSSITEIRTISNNLMPNVLANFGLKEGIKRLCLDFESNSGIRFDFNCEDFEDTKLEPKIQIYIFRIIQELLNNIIKHSSAQRASLNISQSDSHFAIQISDNGTGFDISQKNSGNGINNIIERTELLGGEIKFESELSKGTKVFLKIPVKYE